MTARTLRSSLKVGVLGLLFMTTACADLVVDNTNEPDRNRALSDALAVESLISGSFQTWWDIQQGRTTRYLSNMADVSLNDALNYGNWDAAFEPRKAIINQPGYQWGYAIEDPFMIQNRALSAIRDGVLVMDGGVQIGAAGADTQRLRAFAKLMQGLFTANIALLYDKGWIVDEKSDTQKNVDEKKLVGYKELMTQARAYLAQARTIAAANTFTTPATWAGQAISSAQLIRIANSYEARMMAGVARTPADRAAIDWTQVLTLINTGVTADFGVNMDGPSGIWSKGSGLKATSSLGGGMAERLVGPADQSGKWQAYEKQEPRVRDWFLVETDDRRVHAPGKPDLSGTLLELQKTANGVQVLAQGPARGNWYQTPYTTTLYRTISQTNIGFAPDLSIKEMNLLRAEALIRLNRAAEALPLINATRIPAGLQPVTVNGDQGARCVPRKVTGVCGNLMDALIYEKRLETLLLSGGAEYFDARGWGILQKGTPLHFPVPALELNSLPMPIYTFGGVGGQDAAP
ncbi:MAG: hypothetical protein EXR95_06250 [Gemmatimonadetes bacterium]|nr:hypothetical protein [Gemmatimonadota bacterium]